MKPKASPAIRPASTLTIDFPSARKQWCQQIAAAAGGGGGYGWLRGGVWDGHAGSKTSNGGLNIYGLLEPPAQCGRVDGRHRERFKSHVCLLSQKDVFGEVPQTKFSHLNPR